MTLSCFLCLYSIAILSAKLFCSSSDPGQNKKHLKFSYRRSEQLILDLPSIGHSGEQSPQFPYTCTPSSLTLVEHQCTFSGESNVVHALKVEAIPLTIKVKGKMHFIPVFGPAIVTQTSELSAKKGFPSSEE